MPKHHLSALVVAPPGAQQKEKRPQRHGELNGNGPSRGSGAVMKLTGRRVERTRFFIS